MEVTTTSDRCPACGGQLTRPNPGQPWCHVCEWNLGAYDPEIISARGWRWLSRLDHDLAFRLDRGLFAEYATEPPRRLRWTAAYGVLVAVSALLVLLDLACLGLGLWLLTVDFPSWAIVPGLLLILLAVGLRPRLAPRPQRRRTLRRDEAPVLFALVDRVAAAVGTSAPQLIAVDPGFNATTSRVGIRQVSTLLIGIPLWITLAPRLRVALLAHELAHDVNGDPTRALVVEPALNTFRRLAESTGAERSLGGITSPDRLPRHFMVLFGELAMWLVSRVFLLAHLGLSALGMRDHQRAEYLADATAADVAGSEAVIELLDRLVLLPSIVTLILYNATTAAPTRWSGMAESFHASRSADLVRLRQLTMRKTSVLDSHPPPGLRARIVESWPAREPAVALSEEESARIDQELAGWYGATHRRLLGAEGFRRQQ